MKDALLSASVASGVAGGPLEVLLVDAEGGEAGATPQKLGQTPGVAPRPGPSRRAGWRRSPRLIGGAAAALTTGLFFALLHGQPWMVLGLSLVGVILGLVY